MIWVKEERGLLFSRSGWTSWTATISSTSMRYRAPWAVRRLESRAFLRKEHQDSFCTKEPSHSRLNQEAQENYRPRLERKRLPPACEGRGRPSFGPAHPANVLDLQQDLPGKLGLPEQEFVPKDLRCRTNDEQTGNFRVGQRYLSPERDH